MFRTSSGLLSCTSATSCYSAISSLRPTSAKPEKQGRLTSGINKTEAIAQGHQEKQNKNKQKKMAQGNMYGAAKTQQLRDS